LSDLFISNQNNTTTG